MTIQCLCSFRCQINFIFLHYGIDFSYVNNSSFPRVHWCNEIFFIRKDSVGPSASLDLFFLLLHLSAYVFNKLFLEQTY